VIYLLTTIGLTPGGSSTLHIHTNNKQNNTKTIYRATQRQCIEQHKKQYIEEHKRNLGTVRAVSRLCELYRDVSLTTEEKAQKKLTHGSRREPVGKMKTEYTEQSICNNKNTII